jgi:FkbM family methyltransferase
MSRGASALGIAGSLAIYYGVPWRGRQLRRLYAPFVAPGSLCFDVGAHVGNRVRAFRRLGARVVAVEPQAACLRWLERFHGRDPSVSIVAAAVGRAAGVGTLHVSERTPTVTTLSQGFIAETKSDPGFAAVRWDAREQVPVVTLDELIATYGVPQFVKLDIEGYEAEALGGLSQPVAALSFEYLPVARAVALECIERLEALGRYRYNHAVGETCRLVNADWRDAAALRAFVNALPPNAPSGDVYAVLER